jgi:hypothetical protein
MLELYLWPARPPRALEVIVRAVPGRFWVLGRPTSTKENENGNNNWKWSAGWRRQNFVGP